MADPTGSNTTPALANGGAFNLANATGLPITTGVSGLGAGVGTALAVATNSTGGMVLTTIPPTTWTATDQSGAALAFTAVSLQYSQYGNMVSAYGTLTYPATADGSNAKISLPVTVPNQPYAGIDGTAINGINAYIKAVVNSSTAAFVTNVGVGVTNVSLTAKTITFMLVYPAS